MEGARVRLRDFRAADLESYEHWLQAGREWQRWDAPYLGDPDPDATRRHLDSVREGIATGDWEEPRWRMVIADGWHDRLLGTVSRYWISKATFWTAIGIDIYDPAWWSKGIGTEALGLWCDYLFASDSRFVRLDMRTWSGNERMIRLAKKLGFSEEARFRKARIVDGRYHDALGFGILREEWERRSGSA